ncbi:MAG: hypothetical protein ACYC3Q_10635 [Gemmatimonadaceae bacterium]
MSERRHEPRGHLARYAAWQFRDYVIEKGIGTLLVAVLGGYLSLMLLRETLQQRGVVPQDVYDLMLAQLVSNLVFVGALFATNGIVSDDRKNGYFRFYFAKPVSMTAFYLQKYLLAFAGFMMVTVLLVPGWMHFFHQPAPAPALYLAVASGFVLYTGIGFLVSAFVRTDWLSFIAIYLAGKVAWMNWGKRDDLLGTLVHALPPVGGQLDELDAAAIHGTLPWKLVAWITGYGVVCLLLGLVALRKRPIGSG